MEKFHLKQAAKKVGVSPRTLLRWEEKEWIKPVPRDYKGWRVYDEALIAEILAFKEKTYEQGDAENNQ